MKKKTIFWFCEKFGKRDEIKTYLGHGDFSIEQGWWLGKKWISYEP